MPTGPFSGPSNPSPIPLSLPWQRFDAPLPLPPPNPQAPRPYPAGLQLTPSVLRPHCHAQDRLIRWLPPFAETSDPRAFDRARTERVMLHGWKPSTLEMYGSGLLIYHIICDVKRVPEVDRAPVSTPLLQSFISALAGSYSASTINNYHAGIRAWHLIHGLSWSHDSTLISITLRGAADLAPPSSSKAKRAPYTVEYLLDVRQHLMLDNSLHAAVWACATSLFYGVARVGELTVDKLSAFDPTIHVRRANIRSVVRDGLPCTAIFIPQTKTSDDGQEIYWSPEANLTDPDAALRHHLSLNVPADDEHLFMHTVKNSRRALTHVAFLRCIGAAAARAGRPPLQGHGFRIGGTLEYLLRGIPFDAVRVKGRWASDAFQLYLRHHAEVMTLHIEAHPSVHRDFVRYTMPSDSSS